MSRTHIGLKHARPTNKRILLSVSALFVVGLSSWLIHDNALFHAQKYRHFMGFSTPSLFAPGEHLIRGCRVYAMFPGERLN